VLCVVFNGHEAGFKVAGRRWLAQGATESSKNESGYQIYTNLAPLKAKSGYRIEKGKHREKSKLT
jgi:hypothetical protein